MNSTSLLIWIVFNIFVLLMLAIDLGVFHRKQHTVTTREALGWTALWITLALGFGAIIYFWRGSHPALEYVTGYAIEYALSMDNVFVFLIIFQYFSIKPQFQHKVLFWGILGAVGFRAAFIFAGAALLHHFEWMFFVFGGFLILTGLRTARAGGEEVHPDRNPVLRFGRRWLPVTDHDQGGHFMVREGGRWMVTPMLLVLLVIETTDIVFALDSIPAVLAITRDPFIAYTSNIFAVLGLRALYFAVSGLMRKLRFLHYGLAAVLVFVGAKMVVEPFYDMPIYLSLGIVAALLGTTVAASVLWPGAPDPEAEGEAEVVKKDSVPAEG